MADNLSTIAFRAELLERCARYAVTAHEGIAHWTSLYNAVQPVSLAPELGDLLRSAWLSGLVTAVETVLTDTLLEVLVAYPAKLGKKQLTVQELNESGSYVGAIQRVARKVVNDLSYASVAEYLGEWQKTVGDLAGITPDQIEAFAELKATRDIYVHSNGTPNEIYERKAGPKARKPGRTGTLQVDEPYLAAASQLSLELAHAVSNTVGAKFPRCTKLGVFEDMWNATCCGKIVAFDRQWEVTSHPHHRKAFEWGWSSSEKALFDVFLRIFHGHHSDISTAVEYALYRWPADTPEGLVIRSWMQCPFHV